MTILKRVGATKDARGRPVTTYGFRFNHRNRQYKRWFKTRDLAVEAEQRLKAALQLQMWEAQYGPRTPRLTTWADAVKDYTAAKAAKRSLSYDLAHLEWWGTHFAGLGLHHLQELTPQAIDQGKAALARQGCVPLTIHHYLSTLRILLNMAVKRWRVLGRNPTESVDWPTFRVRTFPVPTVAQIHALVQHADPVLRAMVLVGVLTGYREGDVIRLTVADLQERPGWVKGYGSKPGREVWLPVTPELEAAIAALGIVGGRLFRRQDGQPLARFPRERWNDLKVAAKVECRFQDLRHAAGSYLAELGIPEATIKQYLGHSSVTVTERYTRPGEAGLHRAAKALARRVQPPARRRKVDQRPRK